MRRASSINSAVHGVASSNKLGIQTGNADSVSAQLGFPQEKQDHNSTVIQISVPPDFKKFENNAESIEIFNKPEGRPSPLEELVSPRVRELKKFFESGVGEKVRADLVFSLPSKASTEVSDGVSDGGSGSVMSGADTRTASPASTRTASPASAGGEFSRKSGLSSFGGNSTLDPVFEGEIGINSTPDPVFNALTQTASAQGEIGINSTLDPVLKDKSGMKERPSGAKGSRKTIVVGVRSGLDVTNDSNSNDIQPSGNWIVKFINQDETKERHETKERQEFTAQKYVQDSESMEELNKSVDELEDDLKKALPNNGKRQRGELDARKASRRRVTWGENQISDLPEYSTDSSLSSSRSPSPVNGSSSDLSTLEPITVDKMREVTSDKIAGDVANGDLNQPFEDLDSSRPKSMEVESTLSQTQTQDQTQTQTQDQAQTQDQVQTQTEYFDEISAQSGGGLQGAVDVAQGPLTLQQQFGQIDENLKGTTPNEIIQKAKELVLREKKTDDYKRGCTLSIKKELLDLNSDLQPPAISVESTKIENNKTQSNDFKTQKGHEVGIFDSRNKRFTFKTLGEGRNIVVAESELVNILTNASNNPSNPVQKGQYYGLYFHDNGRGQLTYSALPFSNQELEKNGFRTLSKQDGPRFLFRDSNDLSKPILIDAEIQMQQVSQQQVINPFGAIRTGVAMFNGIAPRVVDKIYMFNGMSPRVVDGGIVSSPEAMHIQPKELFR